MSNDKASNVLSQMSHENVIETSVNHELSGKGEKINSHLKFLLNEFNETVE